MMGMGGEMIKEDGKNKGKNDGRNTKDQKMQ